jgi:hypothetical protein
MTDLLVDLSSWALGKTSCAGAIGYRRWLGGGSKQPDRLPNDPALHGKPLQRCV